MLTVPDGELARLPGCSLPSPSPAAAVYDALVGLAARAGGVPLATRDARALGTYSTLGVDVEIITAS